MNVLYFDWPCFGKVDVIYTLEQMGHQVHPFFHADYQERYSDAFTAEFESFVKGTSYDFCFSYNYFPILSERCKKHNIKYVSVIYDNPYVMLFSYTLIYPSNYVFLFDYDQYIELKKAGIPTVYYTALPVNSDIIDHLMTKDYDHDRLTCDVSFVGALYNEDHNFFDRLGSTNEYLNGYLDGIMNAQLKVSGYNFIEEVLTPDIITQLQELSPYTEDSTGVQTPAYVYANYFINRKLTQIERQQLLSAVAARHSLKLFTLNPSAVIPHARNMGVADYYSEMPYVFHESKINLNISLRSIKSGIPLRCMDILGAGGFLLTNYQADFLRHFVPDEDFVYYEDESDLLTKVDYYLSHDKERREIAANGHEKTRRNHCFDGFFRQVFDIIFDK